MIIKILFGGFTFPEEVVNYNKIVYCSSDTGEFGGPAFELRDISQKFFGLFRVVPEAWLSGLIFLV